MPSAFVCLLGKLLIIWAGSYPSYKRFFRKFLPVLVKMTLLFGERLLYKKLSSVLGGRIYLAVSKRASAFRKNPFFQEKNKKRRAKK